MAKVWVNGQEIEIGDDERLNGIQVAKRAGADVPHYCWHPGLSVVASCRMCLVETGTRKPDGEIMMTPKLVPGCQTPARDGSVFITESEKIKHARSLVEECLLMDHPIDCPICDKAGECSLQDYHFEHGQKERRADLLPFHSRRRDVGPTVTLFVDRCIMCTRCVRFTREISGTSELMIEHRGAHEEINIFPGFPLNNKLSGNVVDLCPVGALGDRDFLYQQRVWYMKSRPSVCGGCSTGCSIWSDENQYVVHRLRPREILSVNQWWMCDEGRYGFRERDGEERLVGPWKRDGDQWTPADWIQLLDELKEKLTAAGRLALVVSPHATVEETYLAAQMIRRFDENAVLAIGPVPTDGEDESYPGGFTIRAEKCPNHRGVANALGRFGPCKDFDELLPLLDDGTIQGAWILGGYRPNWITEDAAAKFSSLGLLIVQDLFASHLSEQSDYFLPATTFLEKEGSFVNHADRLQSFRWAVRPPSGIRTEANVFRRLSEESGMHDAGATLQRIASEIPYFSAVSLPVPDDGLDLKINQLAGTSS
ncbi:MAG: molybdopterin-dependent oxidoreductase [Planctomycetales bacterium]